MNGANRKGYRSSPSPIRSVSKKRLQSGAASIFRKITVSTKKRNAQPEADEQMAVIKWARLQLGLYPELRWLHCSLNGMKMTAPQAARAKRMGMIAGVLDLFLPAARGDHPGLYIEMKSDKGRPTDAQREFADFVWEQGYSCEICYSAEEAIGILIEYLRLPKKTPHRAVLVNGDRNKR